MGYCSGKVNDDDDDDDDDRKTSWNVVTQERQKEKDLAFQKWRTG